MHLVPFRKSTQNCNGVLHGGLANIDLLKAALKGGVLLHILAVLIKRGSADHAQLTPCEHRLDHVAGIHGALRAASSNEGVDLVNKCDDITLGVGDFLEHGFQSLFELTAILRPREH